MGPAVPWPPVVASVLEAVKAGEASFFTIKGQTDPRIKKQLAELLSVGPSSTEVAALCSLLDEIRSSWPASQVTLSALAAVIQAVAQATPRFHTVAFVAELPWPLSAAAGARAGPALASDPPSLQSKEDMFARGLAWRLLGLTTDIRARDVTGLSESLGQCVRSHVSSDSTAAAFAILAIVRRHPPALSHLLDGVAWGLCDQGTSSEAKGYLLQACWYAPAQVTVGARNVVESSLVHLQADEQPALLVLALEALTALALALPREEPSPLQPLCATLLHYALEGGVSVDVAAAATSLLLRALLSKEGGKLPSRQQVVDAVLVTVRERLAVPSEPVTTAICLRIVTALQYRAATAEATQLREVGTATARASVPSSPDCAFSPVAHACVAYLASQTDPPVVEALLAAVEHRCTRVLSGDATVNGRKVNGERRLLLSALLLLAGGRRDGAEAGVRVASKAPRSIQSRLLPQLAWVDRWGVVGQSLLQSEHASQLGLPGLVSVLRAARGLLGEDGTSRAARYVEAALSGRQQPDDGDAMDVDDGHHLPGSSLSAWHRYQLAREAILTGFFATAHKALVQGPTGSSEAVRLWVQCLSVLSQAEACVADGVKDEDEGPLLQARGHYASVLQLLSFMEGRPGGAPHTFKRRFVEARVEMLRVEAAARALCRELMISGRPGGYKNSRQYTYQKRMPRAFRRLAHRFATLLHDCLQDGPQTRWVLRSLVSACLLTAKAWEMLVLQQPAGKAASSGAGSAGVLPMRWPSSGPEERLPLFRVCRALHDRLLNPACLPAKGLAFDDSVKAMLSFLSSLARVPFPYPRRFFSFSHPWTMHLFLTPLPTPTPPPAAGSSSSKPSAAAALLPPPLDLSAPPPDDSLPLLELPAGPRSASLSVSGFLSQCEPETVGVLDHAVIQATVCEVLQLGSGVVVERQTVRARVDRSGAFQAFLHLDAAALSSRRERGADLIMTVQATLQTARGQAGGGWRPYKPAPSRCALQLSRPAGS